MNIKKILKQSTLVDKAYRACFAVLAKSSPVMASKVKYYISFGKRLNLKKPKSFNEKMMWLKLYEDDSLKSICADKVLVREYVKKLGFSDILIDIYHVYDKVEDIDFGLLPKSFVLKCNHGSGCNIVCTDKDELNKEETLSKVRKWMKTDYSLISAEPHYSRIAPKILIEKFLGTKSGAWPIDYKFHCFHGEPQIIETISERETGDKKSIMFDKHWNALPYTLDSLNFSGSIEKPARIDDMLEIARKLSRDFTYVRVDLYYYEGRIYFGELTFTPAGCVDIDLLEQAEIEMGRLLKLEK